MLGYLYGYLASYRFASGLLTPLLAALLGSLVGLAASRALARCNVRNNWVAAAIAATAASVALYLAWAAWITAVLRALRVPAQLTEVLFHPATLLRDALAVDRTGHWTFLTLRPQGAELAALWIAEAAITYVAAIVMTETQLNERGFCEACRRWTRKNEAARLPAAGFLDFRRHLEEHDLAYLAGLGEVPADATSWTALDLHACSCGELNLLDARAVALRGRPGRQKPSQSALFSRLLLRSDEARAVRALSARQQQAAVRARAAAASAQPAPN